MSGQVTVRAVERAIDVLFGLTDGSQTLGKLAEQTGLSKATVHRLLASLARRQLVTQAPGTGEYLLGPGCIRLVDPITRGVGGLTVMAEPCLERLGSITGETITLHVRAGTQRICVGELPSPQPVRYTTGIGSAYPIHTGSAGKVLLAFSEPRERDRLLDKLRLESMTERTITERAALERELEQTRQRGWARSRGERVSGASGLSAPIFDAHQHVLAALSILGPDTRLTDAAARTFRPELLAAASEISARLLTDGTADVVKDP